MEKPAVERKTPDPANHRRSNPIHTFFAHAARFFLLLTVTVSPWLFGGAVMKYQVVLFAGVLLSALCWFPAFFTESQRRTSLPAVVLPLLLAILVGWIQLLPLPNWILNVASPKSLAFWELSKPATHSAKSTDDSPARTISMNHNATRADLALLTLAVASFLLGSRLFDREKPQMTLHVILALNGLALTIFAMIQQMTWNGNLYWRVPLSQGGMPWGPYVNRNNCAGYLNLCLGSALGLLVWAIRKDSKKAPRYDTIIGVSQKIVWYVSRLDGLKLTGITIAGAIAAGVLASLSRGAILSLILALILTVGIHAAIRKSWFQLIVIPTVILVGLVCVAWIGRVGNLQSRVATLASPEAIKDARLPNWRDAVGAVPDFWIFGAGLGSYRYIYFPYQQTFAAVWFYHAENQYIEALVDAGVIGLGLMLSAIALVTVSLLTLIRPSKTDQLLFSYAGMFVLTSQFFHSIFDFGHYMPANAITFATLLGAVCGRASLFATERMARHSRPTRWSSLTDFKNGWLCFGIIGIVTALLIVGVRDNYRTAGIDQARRQARSLQINSRTEPADVESRQKLLQSAIDRFGIDAEACAELAELKINLFRLKHYQQLRERDNSSNRGETLWTSTDTLSLYYNLFQVNKTHDEREAQKILNDPLIRNYLKPATIDLHNATWASPLMARAQLRLGELCIYDESYDASITYLDRARMLRPTDPILASRVGFLDFSAERDERALAAWKDALRLGAENVDGILSIARTRIPFKTLVELTLPPNPELFLRLARTMAENPNEASNRDLLLAKAEELITDPAMPSGLRSYSAGVIRLLRREYSEAIEAWERALQAEPNQLPWRLEVIDLLVKRGKIEDANRHLRAAVRQAPDDRRVRALQERMAPKPETEITRPQTKV